MMMNDQITSLDQSKRLLDNGIRLDSVFFYYVPNQAGDDNKEAAFALALCQSNNTALVPGKPGVVYLDDQSVPAYSSSDLGRLLPARFATSRIENGSVYYRCYSEVEESNFTTGITEIEAKIEMLLREKTQS